MKRKIWVTAGIAAALAFLIAFCAIALNGLLDAADAESVMRWQACQDPAFPVTAITLQPLLRMARAVAFISVVSPLLEMQITTSPGTSCPQEPCTASVPCRKYVGVPVEDRSDAM